MGWDGMGSWDGTSSTEGDGNRRLYMTISRISLSKEIEFLEEVSGCICFGQCCIRSIGLLRDREYDYVEPQRDLDGAGK